MSPLASEFALESSPCRWTRCAQSSPVLSQSIGVVVSPLRLAHKQRNSCDKPSLFSTSADCSHSNCFYQRIKAKRAPGPGIARARDGGEGKTFFSSFFLLTFAFFLCREHPVPGFQVETMEAFYPLKWREVPLNNRSPW